MTFSQPLAVRERLRELGRLIRAARHQRGHTQATLAARAGTSVATVKRLEKGGSSVSWGVVVTACWLLDLPTDPTAVDASLRAKLLHYTGKRAHRNVEVGDDF